MRGARRPAVAALVGAAVIIGLFPSAALGAPPPLPDSMAAVGDSITQAASTGGGLGDPAPQNSWSTGTTASVNSHLLRLQALKPQVVATNLSFNGGKMADLDAQMQSAVALQPDYLTVLIGGNDICTDTEAQMTSVSDFRAQFQAAMARLSSGSPDTNIYVVSIPRVLGLWELFRNDWFAQFIWSLGNICQSLLDNPTSSQTADVQRRQRVAQRNVDFNAVLAEVCAATPRCLWDGWAVYNTPFTTNDVAGDYFHPSAAGQAKLAAVTWAAGYWADGAPPPPPPDNQAPVASFTFDCAELTCSFDASASSDGDGSIVSYDWAFGTDGSASGVAPSHTFSAAGTYSVDLTVTDDDGATATSSAPVTVSLAPPPEGPTGLSLATASGSSASRKGGWTATITVSVLDNLGDPVSGATVSGTWSTGGSGGCTTGGAGSCSFSANMPKKTASATWTVTGISHATLAYDPGGNTATGATATRP